MTRKYLPLSAALAPMPTLAGLSQSLWRWKDTSRFASQLHRVAEFPRLLPQDTHATVTFQQRPIRLSRPAMST